MQLMSKNISNEATSKVDFTDKYFKVLMIEDDEDDALLIKKLLEDNEAHIKFSVYHTKRLSEGLQYLGNNLVNVILLDLSLPDSDTHETIKEIKSRYFNAPVVILTGSTLARNDLRECLSRTSNYLMKGYIDSDSLVKSILQVEE